MGRGTFSALPTSKSPAQGSTLVLESAALVQILRGDDDESMTDFSDFTEMESPPSPSDYREEDRRLQEFLQQFIDECVHRDMVSLQKGLPYGHHGRKECNLRLQLGEKG